MRAFARDALACNSKLRTIKIHFTPIDHFASGMQEAGYPWDRVDRLRDEFSPYGLVIEYNEPLLTKEEWLEVGKPAEGGQYEAESADALGVAEATSLDELCSFLWP